jgi:hypothetical protein
MEVDRRSDLICGRINAIELIVSRPSNPESAEGDDDARTAGWQGHDPNELVRRQPHHPERAEADAHDITSLRDRHLDAGILNGFLGSNGCGD